jgi:chromate transport protein ChrA
VTQPGFGEATRAWVRVAALSFGGPAAQIAVMHRILVEEKGWIDERRFLHALNFCMLLPGPEAQQLATYLGWMLHGVRGGLVAGLLFILPGFVSILALSYIYVWLGDAPAIEGLLFGLKAAVLAVVLVALDRLRRRALKGPLLQFIALASFIALFFLQLPFPLVILGAALLGFWQARYRVVEIPPPAPAARPTRTALTAAIGLAAWLGPLALVAWLLGPQHLLSQLGLFFSQVAVVSFGGAYAVLAYVAQHAVEAQAWLSPAGNGRRARAGGDDAGAAHPGAAVRRVPGRVAGRGALRPGHGGAPGEHRRHLGDLRAVLPVDLRRRALGRPAAGLAETRRRHGGGGCGGGGRGAEPVAVVCAARAVSRGRRTPLGTAAAAGAGGRVGRLRGHAVRGGGARAAGLARLGNACRARRCGGGGNDPVAALSLRMAPRRSPCDEFLVPPDAKIRQHGVADDPVRAHQERSAAHDDAERAVHAVGLDGDLVRVREQGELQLVLVAKPRVARRVLGRDADHAHARGGDLVVHVANGAGFLGAPGREIGGVEIQHQRAVAEQPGEGHLAAVLVGEAEVRGAFTGFEHGRSP